LSIFRRTRRASWRGLLMDTPTERDRDAFTRGCGCAKWASDLAAGEAIVRLIACPAAEKLGSHPEREE
jgi:hypothetical protein